MKKIMLLLLLFFSYSFYAQKDTLAIVRHTEDDIVTPKEVKIVYRGVSNKLFIEVPNSKSFEVSGSGITKVSQNIYNINPQSGSNMLISIDIVLMNNKKVIEKHNFKIKNVPVVVATFNKILSTSVIKFQKNAFKYGSIGAKIPDNNIEEVFEVTGFTIKIPGMGAIKINGNKIDDNTYEKIIKYTSRGDQVTVSEIKTRTIKSDFNIMCIMTSPMVIEIL